MQIKTIFTRKLQGNSYLSNHLKVMRIETIKRIKAAQERLARPVNLGEWLEINSDVMRELG
jgi:hypothetical protein